MLPLRHIPSLTSRHCRELGWPGGSAQFEIDPQIKHRLLNGLDDIAQTLQHGDSIDAYERDRERSGPMTLAL